MRKFLRNLLLALIPVAVINALCWGTLVFLAWQDDLTYVNYASALDKEKRLEELGNQSRLLIIGGSNARFGFDSSILRDTLHLEPVNMGIICLRRFTTIYEKEMCCSFLQNIIIFLRRAVIMGMKV